MDSLEMLYQQIILDHSRHPRFYGKEESIIEHDCYNPLCGDEIQIYCKTKDGKIEHLTFTGKGCAICIASASLMAEKLQGVSIEEFKEHFSWYTSLVKGEEVSGKLGKNIKLEVMQGVSKYPMRVKCATCAWHALEDAINNQEEENNEKNH